MIRLTVGVEIYADRSKTAIVLAGIPEPGVGDIELLPLVDGADAVPAVAELAVRCEIDAVAVDPRSNAATLVEPLRRAGLPVKEPDARDMAVAHGRFADLMTAGKLRHHNQPEMTAAVRFAQARKLAGAAALERYGTSADAAPAVAAELAIWALGDLSKPSGEGPFVLFGR
jgi:hypothetical protein